MKKFRSHVRANVVGYLALFVALGGTAAAVTQLDPNSVRSIHISNGQVKRPDIAANAVNSAKVANGSLGPQDFSGTTANIPPATFIDTGLPDTCDGSESWHDFSAGASYYRDPAGIVHLRRPVQNCEEPGPIFTLPLGYRPEELIERHLVFVFRFGGEPYTQVEIHPDDGEVIAGVPSTVGLPTGTTVFLDGITFRCGPAGVNGCP